jgi:hypothetical protein
MKRDNTQLREVVLARADSEGVHLTPLDTSPSGAMYHLTWLQAPALVDTAATIAASAGACRLKDQREYEKDNEGGKEERECPAHQQRKGHRCECEAPEARSSGEDPDDYGDYEQHSSTPFEGPDRLTPRERKGLRLGLGWRSVGEGIGGRVRA